jgi:hypothetical protein
MGVGARGLDMVNIKLSKSCQATALLTIELYSINLLNYLININPTQSNSLCNLNTASISNLIIKNAPRIFGVIIQIKHYSDV